MASFSEIVKVDFSGREVWGRMHTMLVMPLQYVLQFFGLSTGIPQGFWGDAAFIGKILAANAASSASQSVSVGLEALIAEALFVTGKFWYYKFLINPQQFRMSNQKLQNIDESSDLTIINTYRNTAPVINLSGISGCTLPRDFMRVMETETALPTETLSRYPKLSAAWIKFRQLEKFYNEINSDIVVMYDMDLYVGKFVSFNYNLSADNPWVINYDMQLRVYPGMVLHTTAVYDYAPFFDTMRQRYGNQFSEDFEGKSN